MTGNAKVPRIGYKKILYNSDLSEVGREAFPHAASLARAYGAQLTILHVVETKEFEKFLVGYINDELWAEIKNRNLQEARNILVGRKRQDSAIRDSVEEFHQNLPQDGGQEAYVTYDIATDMGEPAERIVEFAHNGGFDLVILAKHGKGALEAGLMGDTAQRVMRHCKVPVMVVPVS
jgi:nucleotide-binding universal stress UspA family protein